MIRMVFCSAMELMIKCADIEKEILSHMPDGETCHMMEDELLSLIVDNMHLLSKSEMVIVQGIVRRVAELNFSRWYA